MPYGPPTDVGTSLRLRFVKKSRVVAEIVVLKGGAHIAARFEIPLGTPSFAAVTRTMASASGDGATAAIGCFAQRRLDRLGYADPVP